MASPAVAADMLNAGNISPSFHTASSTHLDIEVNGICHGTASPPSFSISNSI